YYLYAFRNVKVYNDHVVNKILEDLKRTLNPYEIAVAGEFSTRGGIGNRVSAHYKARK
ncbi:MAG: 7-cyano-7-deazaguanine reductase, partial [Candidatus Omnitrophota bacterium]